MLRKKPAMHTSTASSRNKVPLRRSSGHSPCWSILPLSLGALILLLAGFSFLRTNPDQVSKSVVFEEHVKVYDYEVIQEFYHDPRAFTQGLVYAGNGTLYESTGLFGQSTVREVDLQSGQVRNFHKMEKKFFGEGLTLLNERLFQVVWLAKHGFIYNKTTLDLWGKFVHSMKDGWGLTNDGQSIIGSDGTSSLFFLRPTDLSELYNVTVKDNGREVKHLNELEYINGEVWANVYLTECIARISPKNGRVVGWIMLHGLRKKLMSENPQLDVLNGIAWDKEENRLFVTGKLWPRLFEIKLKPLPRRSNSELAAVREACIQNWNI